jgi:putative membrane protein
MKIGRWQITHEEPSVWKGLAAGLVAGLAGTIVMTKFQELCSEVTTANDGAGDGKQEKKNGSGRKSAGAQKGVRASRQGGQKEQHSESDEENSTEKVAAIISTKVFDHSLSKPEKKIAGQGVHYAFGTLTGGVYGVESELMPVATTGAGMPFGASVWLLMDEVALPVMGLSKSPTEYPLATHAYALSAHLVYGLTTEIVRRVVRRAL